MIILTILLACSTIALLVYVRHLRLERNRQREAVCFIEDLLKSFYDVGTYEMTFSDACRIAALPPERVRQHLHLAHYRGWIRFVEGKESFTVSKAGRLYGAQVKRTHRLYERYLAEKTSYPTSEWHRRAEKMEHYLSPQEVEEMSRRLGNPLFDPHGKPIPIPLSEEQHTATTPPRIPTQESLIPLSALPLGVTATIASLSDEIIGEKRRRLSDLGFVKGGEVRVYIRSTFAFPVAYLVRDTAIALRREQAEKIWVLPHTTTDHEQHK